MANDTPGPDVPSDGEDRQAGHPTSPYARPQPAGPTARHGLDEGAPAGDAPVADGSGDDDVTPSHGIRQVPNPAGGYGGGGRSAEGPYGGPPGARPPNAPYGAPGHGYGAGAFGYAPGTYGAPGRADPARESGRRVGRATLVGFALVTALLGGLIGGVVGASLTGGSGGSTGVLGAPLPGVDEAAVPIGPVEAVAERVVPSVVRLLVQGGGAAGEGSGMVLSPDGLMLTNNHVVAPAAGGGAIVAIFQNGTSAPAEIVGLDPSSDLAVIRAQGVSGLTPIRFGNSDAVRVGQQVVAVGSPLGLGGTVTTGIVSAVDRTVSVGADSGAAEATVLSALQTDAAINPGNSGGPLTDMEGRVVGINSVIATTGAEGGSIGVGFAIPINQARRTAQELEASGVATRAILGANVNANPAERNGAVLGPLVPGGPADAAGLSEGQTVTRVGDRLVTNGSDLIAAIRENAPGDQVTLIVDGEPVEVVLSGESG